MALTTAPGRPGLGAGVPTGIPGSPAISGRVSAGVPSARSKASSCSPASKNQSMAKTAWASRTISPVTSTDRSSQRRPARTLRRVR